MTNRRLNDDRIITEYRELILALDTPKGLWSRVTDYTLLLPNKNNNRSLAPFRGYTIAGKIFKPETFQLPNKSF